MHVMSCHVMRPVKNTEIGVPGVGFRSARILYDECRSWLEPRTLCRHWSMDIRHLLCPEHPCLPPQPPSPTKRCHTSTNRATKDCEVGSIVSGTWRTQHRWDQVIRAFKELSKCWSRPLFHGYVHGPFHSDSSRVCYKAHGVQFSFSYIHCHLLCFVFTILAIWSWHFSSWRRLELL